jgi:hypothetical protein
MPDAAHLSGILKLKEAISKIGFIYYNECGGALWDY